LPHLKKKLIASVAFPALFAAVWFAPLTALGQSASPFGRSQFLNRLDTQGRDAGAIDINGLRGGYETDDEISREDGRDTGRRAFRQDGQGSPVTGSQNDTLISDVENAVFDQAPLRERADEEEEDPFAPLGIRVGSFLFYPELFAETVYSDNIFLSSANPRSDWAIEFTPLLLVRSDWNRHSLTGTIGGVRSYYERFETENEETFLATLSGQIDIRRDTNLVVGASYSQKLGDRSDTDFPSGSFERPQERFRDVSLEGNHTFNRVQLTLRGEISSEDYEDGRRIDGTIINNDDRDFTERRLTGRAGYEFQPGVAAFVEASTNERKFDERIDDNGTLNGSSGYDIQGGLSFQLTQTLTGEVSAGYALQTSDDPALDDVDGLIFNAGLEWLATGLTTLRFDAASTVAETTLTGSAGSIVRSAELSVEHRPRRNIVLGASVGFEREEFSGSGGEDDEWLLGVTGEYIFTRSVAMTLAYGHLMSTSSSPGSDYSVNEVRVGLRLRR